MNLFHYPMPRITLGMLAGCFIGSFYSPLPITSTSLAVLVFGLILLGYFSDKKIVTGLSVILISVGLGIFSVWVHRESNYSSHYLNYCVEGKQQTLQAVVREQLKSTPKAKRYVVQIQTLDRHPCFGKLLLNCSTNSKKSGLTVGMSIQCKGIIHPNCKPRNPNAFDYGSYLNHKLIYAQVWVDLHCIQRQQKIVLDAYYFADLVRKRISNHLEKSGCDPATSAVFNALLLGQQQDIPDQITQAYQYAGVVHILSVSGLHVGFIIMLLRAMFRVFPQKRAVQKIELWFSLIVLWCFAWIAGLSPSVLRAVTVFSFVCVGNFINRKSSNLNNLFISAFMILLVQPEALFDIGFQLSYAALLFIFIVHPQLQKLIRVKSKIGRYFWENCSVCLAAQLGTLPLSLYYFHQFPGLFLVANLLLLPYLIYLMGLCVLCLVWLLVTVPPQSLVWLLEKSIGCMNQLISWLASFDLFVFREIPFTLGMAFTLYFVFFTISLVLYAKRFVYWFSFGISLLCFQLAWFIPYWNSGQEQELVIFHHNQFTALIERKGHNLIAFTDLPTNKRQALTRYATAHFCNTIAYKKIPGWGIYNKQVIFLIDDLNKSLPVQKNSLIVLHKSPKLNVDYFILRYHPKSIIADGSNYKSLIRLWKASCIHAKIPFHSTREKGFYRVK